MVIWFLRNTTDIFCPTQISPFDIWTVWYLSNIYNIYIQGLFTNTVLTPPSKGGSDLKKKKMFSVTKHNIIQKPESFLLRVNLQRKNIRFFKKLLTLSRFVYRLRIIITLHQFQNPSRKTFSQTDDDKKNKYFGW